jgi:KDO2-lipid IV(A) lauroyltransferase
VAYLQGLRGLPLDLVTRRLDNPALERLLARRRRASGNRILHKHTAVRGILRSLGERRGVAIVIDQNVRSGSRVFVPFFGRLAATTPTLALVALRTGAPVVPVFSVPGRGAAYRIVYLPPVEVPSSGDRDRDVLELTSACTAIIERWVRRHPECWLWMHDRWKSRPGPDEIPAGGSEAAAG